MNTISAELPLKKRTNYCVVLSLTEMWQLIMMALECLNIAEV